MSRPKGSKNKPKTDTPPIPKTPGKRGRKPGTKNKSKEETPPVETKSIVETMKELSDMGVGDKHRLCLKCNRFEITCDCQEPTFEQESSVVKEDEIRKELDTPSNEREYNWGNHGKEAIDQLNKALEDKFKEQIGTKNDAINELMTFGTVTTKTELVDGKASVKVVDKKKVVNDEDDWKPKLSPFMLSRQKSKSGGK